LQLINNIADATPLFFGQFVKLLRFKMGVVQSKLTDTGFIALMTNLNTATNRADAKTRVKDQGLSLSSYKYNYKQLVNRQGLIFVSLTSSDLRNSKLGSKVKGL
jgi:hypothetical protein